MSCTGNRKRGDMCCEGAVCAFSHHVVSAEQWFKIPADTFIRWNRWNMSCYSLSLFLTFSSGCAKLWRLLLIGTQWVKLCKSERIQSLIAILIHIICTCAHISPWQNEVNSYIFTMLVSRMSVLIWFRFVFFFCSQWLFVIEYGTMWHAASWLVEHSLQNMLMTAIPSEWATTTTITENKKKAEEIKWNLVHWMEWANARQKNIPCTR